MNWIYMAFEIGIFLTLSAAMWLIIKRAETEPDAEGANEPPARAAAPRVDAVEVRATGLQAREHQDQLVIIGPSPPSQPARRIGASDTVTRTVPTSPGNYGRAH